MTWEQKALESMKSLCKIHEENKMNNKCHYNGPEFVPCKEANKMPDSFEYSFEYPFDIGYEAFYEFFNVCPFCGAGLEKPEEPQLPWWLVPGMLIEDKETGEVGKIRSVNKERLLLWNSVGDSPVILFIKWFKPIGGPFDMIPEWATEIKFKSEGSYGGMFYQMILNKVYKTQAFPVWHDCPEEFKGKTFSLDGLC